MRHWYAMLSRFFKSLFCSLISIIYASFYWDIICTLLLATVAIALSFYSHRWCIDAKWSIRWYLLIVIRRGISFCFYLLCVYSICGVFNDFLIYFNSFSIQTSHKFIHHTRLYFNRVLWLQHFYAVHSCFFLKLFFPPLIL